MSRCPECCRQRVTPGYVIAKLNEAMASAPEEGLRLVAEFRGSLHSFQLGVLEGKLEGIKEALRFMCACAEELPMPKRARTWSTCSKGHKVDFDVGERPDLCSCGARVRVA